MDKFETKTNSDLRSTNSVTSVTSMRRGIQCLRVARSLRSSISLSTRCFSNSLPNRSPRKPPSLLPSSTVDTSQKTKAVKFNPLTKNAAFKVPRIPDDNPYQWSSIKPPSDSTKSPLRNSAWEINKEQNLISKLRIDVGVIDPKQTPDEEMERSLTEWNRQHGRPPTKSLILLVLRVDM